ncbi:MAG: hypothetical protein ABIG30_03830 [Candidatus Aenigmatarchaeota archaeon]
MAFEITQLLFGDILRCDWCLAHQTGNIMEDVVMLFLLPTIILILFVYVLLKDLKIIPNKMMRLLLGFAVYMFVIFGGYYNMFAELAKTYFVILIFVLGIMYFVVGHFIKGPATAEGAPGGGGEPGLVQKYMESGRVKHDQKKELLLVRDEINHVQGAMSHINPGDINSNAVRAQFELQLNQLKRKEKELLIEMGKIRVH